MGKPVQQRGALERVPTIKTLGPYNGDGRYR